MKMQVQQMIGWKYEFHIYGEFGTTLKIIIHEIHQEGPNSCFASHYSLGLDKTPESN